MVIHQAAYIVVRRGDRLHLRFLYRPLVYDNILSNDADRLAAALTTTTKTGHES